MRGACRSDGAKGNFAVSADGAATYSIPIALPKGRAGMEPSVSIGYSSQGGNGLLGVGWSLSAGASQISRCGSTMRRDGAVRPVQFGPNDHFCLDGARLVPLGTTITIPECTGSNPEYRTVPDSFSRVVACGSDGAGPLRWVVYTKGGRILRYGDTASARLEATVPVPHATYGTPTATTVLRRLAWLVAREADRVGNYMTFTYWRDPSLAVGKVESLLSRIDYVGFVSPAAAPTRTVEFRYEWRPDPSRKFMHGVEVSSRWRLARILTHGPAAAGESWPASPPETTLVPVAMTAPTVRRYELSYDASAFTGRSRLKQVRTCDPFGACLPATQLTYSDASPTFPESDQGDFYAQDVHFSDFDGDGRDDVLYSDAQQHYALRRSTGTSFGPAVAATITGGIFTDGFSPGPLILFDRTNDGAVDAVREVCTDTEIDTLPNGEVDVLCNASRLLAHVWNGTTLVPRSSYESREYRPPLGPDHFIADASVDITGDLAGDLLRGTTVIDTHLGNLKLSPAYQALRHWTPQDGTDFGQPAKYLDLDGDNVRGRPELRARPDDDRERRGGEHRLQRSARARRAQGRQGIRWHDDLHRHCPRRRRSHAQGHAALLRGPDGQAGGPVLLRRGEPGDAGLPGRGDQHLLGERDQVREDDLHRPEGRCLR
jgi:hypothetical protein